MFGAILKKGSDVTMCYHVLQCVTMCYNVLSCVICVHGVVHVLAMLVHARAPVKHTQHAPTRAHMNNHTHTIG